MKWVVILVVLAGVSIFYFMWGWDDFRNQFFSQAPSDWLEGVSPEERERLKIAANSEFIQKEPLIAVAISRTNKFMPEFYVASNLPNGSKILLQIKAVKGTLIDALDYSSEQEIIFHDSYAKTKPFNAHDGSPLPQGEYNVYVFDSKDQPKEVQRLFATVSAKLRSMPGEGRKFTRLFTKEDYFLGTQKDEHYITQIKLYHNEINEQSRRELKYLKEFTESLDKKWKKTHRIFKKISTLKNDSAQQIEWKKFHKKWNKTQEKIVKPVSLWTPDTIKHKKYHGQLFVLLKNTAVDLAQIHKRHNIHIMNSKNTADLENLELQISNNIQFLNEQIEKVKQFPKGANGLPKRLPLQVIELKEFEL